MIQTDMEKKAARLGKIHETVQLIFFDPRRGRSPILASPVLVPAAAVNTVVLTPELNLSLFEATFQSVHLAQGDMNNEASLVGHVFLL